MTDIRISKLDKHAYEQVRIRAKKRNVSVEEEVRLIIYRAVFAPVKISAVFKKYFGSKNGIDLIKRKLLRTYRGP